MDQPACLEEDFVTDLKSSTEMAFGESRPYYFPCRNLFLTNLVEDELAKDLGLVRGLYSCNTSSDLSRNPTLGPALIPASAPAPIATNDLFIKFMKVYFESN